MDPRRSEPTEAELEIQRRFDPANADRFSSVAQEAARGILVQKLSLPEEERGPMPFTKERMVTNENPLRVEWEREVRKFLRRLDEDGHRITAPMIYEWTTGISLRELRKAEGVDDDQWRGGAGSGSANTHLRHINAILLGYFGKPYKTTIMGRHVGRAYTVRKNFRVKDKKPMSLNLWPDWKEGTLDQ